MGFLFSGVFWGLILVLLGLAIIIRVVFNIHIPVFRIVFALVLIFLGLKVLVGGNWFRSDRNSAIFQQSRITINNEATEYNIVFGSAVIDAGTPLQEGKGDTISVNTVFGESRLTLSSSVPTLVKVNALFSGARMPDGNQISFGEYIYKNKAYSDTAAFRKIEVNVVFGSLVLSENRTN